MSNRQSEQNGTFQISSAELQEYRSLDPHQTDSKLPLRPPNTRNGKEAYERHIG